MQRIKVLPFPQFTLKNILFILSILLITASSACAGASPAPAPAATEVPPAEASTQAQKANAAPAADVSAQPPAAEAPAGPTEAAPPPASAPEMSSVDEAALKGLTINFWHTMSDEQIKPMVEEFNRTNPWGITVKDWYQSNSSRLSVNVRRAIVENNLPQVALGYADQASLWDLEGGTVELSPYVNDAKWGLTAEDQKDYLPAFWNYGQVGQKRLALPAIVAGTFLLYNQSWAREMGYDSAPDSLENFKAQACAANEYQRKDTIVQNDSTGGWLVNTDPAVILAWLQAYGAKIIDQDTANPYNSTYQFESDPAVQMFAFLKSMVDKNCVWTSSESYADEDFVNRRALFASGGTVDLPFQTLAFTEAGSKDEWTLLPFPALSGDPVVGVQVPSLILLKSKPEEQLGAWLFMRWITSPPAQAQWTALTGYFPVRASTVDLMKEYAASHPQWAAGRDLLKYARTEPSLPSWGDARWVMGDAGVQLFRPYFTADRIKATLHELDRTVAEIRDMTK